MTWSSVKTFQLDTNWIYTDPVDGDYFRLTQQGNPIADYYLVAQAVLNEDGSLSLYNVQPVTEDIVTVKLEVPLFFDAKTRRIAIRYSEPPGDAAALVRQVINPIFLMPTDPYYAVERFDWTVRVEVSDQITADPVAGLKQQVTDLATAIAGISATVASMAQQMGTVTSEVAAIAPELQQIEQKISQSSSSSTTNATSPPTLPYKQAVLADSPIGYWQLDEASGIVAADSSKSNIAGTYVNNPTFKSPGATQDTNDTSILLDGSNQYVNFGNSNTFQVNTISMEGLFKTNYVAGDYRAIFCKSGAFGLFVINGTLITYDFSAGDRYTSKTVSDGKWHHVVLTSQSGANNGTIIYLDGQPILTTTVTVVSQTANLLGGSNSGAQMFPGNLAKLAIYDYILSPQRVLAHYNAAIQLESSNSTSSTQAPTQSSTSSSTQVVPQSLFTNQTPTGFGRGSYELGMRFRSAVAGTITAIRYYKSGSETGLHAGNFWSNTGTLLGSVSFSNESDSGWQQQNLNPPLSINANTNYVVSYNTNGYYSYTINGLSSAITNGSLSSVVDGNNGVYSNPGVFPTQSGESTNYFVDVVFAPTNS